MRMLNWIFLLLLTFGLSAQQINYTYGKQTPSGVNWPGNGIVYIDTTSGTTNNIIVDLNDYYFLDWYPLETNATGDFGVGGDSTLAAALYGNSTRFYCGTFYCYFPIPRGTKSGYKFKNAQDASLYILKNAFVSTVAWDDAGSYLRFSVTYEAPSPLDEINVMKDLKTRLLNLNLIF